MRDIVITVIVATVGIAGLVLIERAKTPPLQIIFESVEQYKARQMLRRELNKAERTKQQYEVTNEAGTAE